MCVKFNIQTSKLNVQSTPVVIRCYNDQIILKRYIWEVIGYFTIKCGIMICEKGTIGLTMSQSDMPFSEEGISPDLIVNPQAIPSRMTVAQLIECLMGKVGAIKGMEVDGTSFNEIDIEKVKDMLEKLGYERNGTEYLYNGMTGQRLSIPIFIGPTYYQRLKHLVMDKMHCLNGQHEVFTENGWINIKDITTNIKVLTLNNNLESFNYPTEIHKYEEDGYSLRTLFYIKNENIDTVMTEEHRVFVNDKLIPINELDRKNNIVYTWKTRTGTFTVNLTTDCEILESGDGVYCLSVPGEIFYVRRNGKEFWTGNSRPRGPITMLTHQPQLYGGLSYQKYGYTFSNCGNI